MTQKAGETNFFDMSLKEKKKLINNSAEGANKAQKAFMTLPQKTKGQENNGTCKIHGHYENYTDIPDCPVCDYNSRPKTIYKCQFSTQNKKRIVKYCGKKAVYEAETIVGKLYYCASHAKQREASFMCGSMKELK